MAAAADRHDQLLALRVAQRCLDIAGASAPGNQRGPPVVHPVGHQRPADLVIAGVARADQLAAKRGGQRAECAGTVLLPHCASTRRASQDRASRA
jgi:hypothetical protein